MSIRIHKLITDISAPPIFAGFITFLLVLYIRRGVLSLIHELTLSLLFVTVIPLGVIFLSTHLGWTTDLHVPKRKNRTRVYFLIFFSYLAGAYTFYYFSNYILSIVFVIYMGISLILGTINIFYKVSVHTAGIAGPVTILSWMLGPEFSLFYLVLLPVYFSRYKLNAHSPRQLMGGIIVSFIVTFTIFTIL